MGMKETTHSEEKDHFDITDQNRILKGKAREGQLKIF